MGTSSSQFVTASPLCLPGRPCECHHRLKGYIGDLDDMIDGGSSHEAGEALSDLYYFDFNSADADDTFYARKRHPRPLGATSPPRT